MKLTLKTRVMTVKPLEASVEVGDEIEYYFFNKDGYIIGTATGVICQDSNGFYINWEDQQEHTYLDGSDKTKKILEHCGWC